MSYYEDDVNELDYSSMRDTTTQEEIEHPSEVELLSQSSSASVFSSSSSSSVIDFIC